MFKNSPKDRFLKTAMLIVFNYLPAFALSKAVSFSSKRVFVFIDGSNFYHSLKKSFGSAKIDLASFLQQISNGTYTKAFYYTSPIDQKDSLEKSRAQQRFLARITKIPNLELFLGRLERRNNTKVEKGVDVKIAVDMLSNAFHDKYDTAILVSNDADFVPLVKEIQQLGKQVININFPKTRSYHLNKTCNQTIEITKIQGESES